MKVLIADDSTLMRERIKSVVNEKIQNVNIFEASSTTNAEEIYKSFVPDLIILDISMPGSNGLELLKRIRLTDDKTKIIILTNYPNQKYKDKAIEYGADYFLSKFEDFEDLAPLLDDIEKESKNSF